MALNTRYYPITFRVRDQFGSPIIESDQVKLKILALDPDGDLSESQAVDLGVQPPVVVAGEPTTEEVSMSDLRRKVDRLITLSSTATDLGRTNLEYASFRAEVKVVDEVALVAGLTVTTANVPVEGPQESSPTGVEVYNVTQSNQLTEGTHYTVNYVDGTITFVSGVNNGDTVNLDYWWLAKEELIAHDDESQTVGPAGGFASDSITLDAVPLDAFDVAIENITQAKTLVEDTDYSVNYATGQVSFLTANAVDGDVVEATYKQLDPTSDYWVQYETGIFTRLTLGDDMVSFSFRYIWEPGLYAYLLDVSELADGRYHINIEYNVGGIVRTGDDRINVRNGTVGDDLLLNDAAGAGAFKVRLRTKEDTDDQEVIGDVLISLLDSEGDRVIQQWRTSTGSGEVAAALPAGTYEVLSYRALFTFDVETIVVTESDTEQVFTILGTPLVSSPTPSANPDCCVVYGNVSSLGCEPASGYTVRARLRKPPLVSGSSAVLATETCVVTDSSGNFSMSLVRGSTVRFDIQGTKYDSVRIVPEAETVFFNDMEQP